MLLGEDLEINAFTGLFHYINLERTEVERDNHRSFSAPSQYHLDLYGKKGKKIEDIFNIPKDQRRPEMSWKSPSNEEKVKLFQSMKEAGNTNNLLYQLLSKTLEEKSAKDEEKSKD